MATLERPAGSLVLPGDILAKCSVADPVDLGTGCYRSGSEVVASARGLFMLETDSSNRSSLSVVPVSLLPAPDGQTAPSKTPHRIVVPGVASVVIGRVVRINPRLAQVRILVCDGEVVDHPFAGIIRQQDIRATQIDSAVVYDSFRPGDIVRAAVLSLGTGRQYFLSTARVDLGVLLAEEGRLVPISWCEMMDPISKRKEPRKVAKP